MYLKYPLSFTIVLVLIGVIIAGCTTTTPPKVNTSTSDGFDTFLSLYQNGTLQWYEYMITQWGGLKTSIYTKTEYNIESFQGNQNVWHMKQTSVKDKGTSRETTNEIDLYYNGNNFLGGYTKIIENGQIMSVNNITINDPSFNYYNGFDQANSTFYGNKSVAIKKDGIETVTVSTGTYACTKYMVSSDNTIYNYWIVDNVPMPIKASITNNKGEITDAWELVGWG